MALKKSITKVDAAKTDSGLIVPVVRTLVQEPFYVKEISEKRVYAVVDGNGKEERVYNYDDGIENPKECAEMYARKLSNTWRENTGAIVETAEITDGSKIITNS